MIFVERHRPIFPFRMSRAPSSGEDTAECYHPIVDFVKRWTVDKKVNYDWRAKEFDARFKALESESVEPALYDYFRNILT
jgi:hypothetical protein